MRTFSLNQINILIFMGSTIFLSVKNTFKSFSKSFIELPIYIKKLIQNVRSEFTGLRHKLNNISASNLELGRYHLGKGNYNDAIFRFKLVEKYLDPNNKVACYWLGWSYLLKGDHKNSITYLLKAHEEDKVNLLEFVKSIDNAGFVPSRVYELYRDITASNFIGGFITNIHDIPKTLIFDLSKNITSLPENYRILELGSNVGLLAYEIHKRMPDNFHLTGTEVSDQMIKLQDSELYNEVLEVSAEDYLLKTEQKNDIQKYDIVCSLNGFANTSDLTKIFHNIFHILNEEGYFAFAVHTAEENRFSDKLLEFSYNNSYLFNLLAQIGFEVILSREFNVEIKNNCSIFVCKKQFKNG